MNRALMATATAALSLLTACEDPGRPGDSPVVLLAVSGGGQEHTVGQSLPEPIVVRVTTREGAPLAGQTVEFRVAAGGGAVAAGSVRSDARGDAATEWTLGTVAGTVQQLEARVADSASGNALATVTVTAVGRPDGPAAIRKTQGDGQTGRPGSVLDEAVGVLIEDRYGNPVPRVPLTWEVTAGAGSAAPRNAITDDAGRAETDWRLGLRAGEHQLLANVTGDANTVPAIFSATALASAYACTLVIGFSQTLSWLAAGFESIVANDQWERLIRNGAGVDRWADPDYNGWSGEVKSACTARADDPDRVLLTISTDGFENDPAWWSGQIRAAVATIRMKYPAVQEVMLQPVVGGPSHGLCTPNGERASTNHPVIDQAIADVAAGDTGVTAGFSPEVRDCDDYTDSSGHLTAEGAAAVAVTTGEYYVSR